MDSIGMRIKLARKKAGIRHQDELADMCGVSRNTVANWETGRTIASGSDLKMIAIATGVSVEWLVSGEKRADEAQTRDEELLLDFYRKLSAEDKLEAITTLASMANDGDTDV